MPWENLPKGLSFGSGIDAASVAQPSGGHETGPSLTDRGKQHIIVDRRGAPLALGMTGGANRLDLTAFEALVDAQRGASDLRRWGILARIACRGAESSRRLGRHRWMCRTHVPGSRASGR